MIAHIHVRSKAFGMDVLYKNLDIRLVAGEKIGVVGRNGTGKSTLLNIIAREDVDFDGEVQFKKGLIVVSSRQEHHQFEDMKVIDYVAYDLPNYAKLKRIIDTYPEKMEGKNHLIQEYADALDHFTQLGYFEVEGEIAWALESYQVPAEKIDGTIAQLSGGQKRLVELVKVQRSKADLALIDEPTNHMDYVAKRSFLDWLKKTGDAVVAVTHDRDLLSQVDRIIEIRDGKAFVFKGDYNHYLAENSVRISSELNEYQVTKQRVKKLEDSIVRFRRLKERARDPDTIAQFKRLEKDAQIEADELKNQGKPSFWIDKESTSQLKPKISQAYDEHKTRNITIRAKTADSRSFRKLISVRDLSLGYDEPLFNGLTFDLREGERLEIRGRNGVGKTTLVQSIIASALDTTSQAHVFDGSIELDNAIRIGEYKQELSQDLMQYTLAEAIEQVYRKKDLDITDQRVKQLMSEYLFDIAADADKPLSVLSGGQKARLQLIGMLAGEPNVLILDEPTNHLDLPSIEELESALAKYFGVIIYISHDSYFTKHIGGQVIQIKPGD